MTYLFEELPANYQQGCFKIQAWCQALLEEAQIPVTSINWETLTLNRCHLAILLANEKFTVSFSRIGLLRPEEMQDTIKHKIKFMIKEIKFFIQCRLLLSDISLS